MNLEISELLGKTLTDVEQDGNEEIIFTVNDWTQYCMYHSQEGYESVTIEDIEGDLKDLIGSPILQAEESTNTKNTFGKIECPASFTWTFYKLATVKGYVTIRWLGESDGCYSERVDFVKL